MFIDFSQSSPPCRGPLNAIRAVTENACFIASRHIFPDVYINSGFCAPFTFNIPETTFLHARLPRAVSGCAAEVSMWVIDCVFGALSQAIPDKVPAAAFSMANNLTMGGVDPVTGEYWSLYLFASGSPAGGEAQAIA